MGNAFDMVLVAPFGDWSRDSPVDAALTEIGFTPAGERPHDVWTRLDQKLPTRQNLDLVIADIIAAPWPVGSDQPWHLTLLWKDEHTMGEDSWGGRVTPYAWHTETITLEPKGTRRG